MKVSYVHGLCVKNDAISNSIRDEISWLTSKGKHDVRLFAYACDHANLPFTQVTELSDAVFDQHFQSSELVIFHFGVTYPLFDLLFVTPKKARRLVVFHNITPKQFVSAECHPMIDKSFKQMTNIIFVDHVVCASQTNLDVLRMAGITTPASVLPLAVHIQRQMPKSKPSHFDGIIRLAFVGRFVRSKGPGELLQALDKVLRLNHAIHLSLNMVGNLAFSDPALLEEVQKAIDLLNKTHEGRFKASLHGNASENEKCEILRDADVFVLPTYHEGFCVPIVEAFAMGCKVIAYENSNTPAISNKFARLTPTGDITALSCEIMEMIGEITSTVWRGNGTKSYVEYSNHILQYVQQYSPERTEQRFLNFIKEFAS